MFALRSTSSFVTLSLYDILNILRKNHISVASSCFIKSLVSVHVSDPYNGVDHTSHFSTPILSWSMMSPDFSTFSSHVNAIPILRRTSFTHLPCDVHMLPRYMKMLTCSKLVPCIVMLHVSMTVDFENTMVKDLDPFRCNPLFSLSRTIMLSSYCNSSSVSAIITVSSAYLKLLNTVPLTLKPPFPLMFLMII